MKCNKEGLDLIKKFEGLRLKAYQDTVGKWTIGYGHTLNVSKGDEITEDTATSFLLTDLEYAETAVMEACRRKSGSPLSSNAFSALCSFVFNLGKGNFRKSTLLKLILEDNMEAAADEFQKWCNAGGKKLPGLMARRLAEKELFLKP